ncbi:13881_t:CDS:2, partial [Gigaspora rosea]
NEALVKINKIIVELHHSSAIRHSFQHTISQACQCYRKFGRIFVDYWSNCALNNDKCKANSENEVKKQLLTIIKDHRKVSKMVASNPVDLETSDDA